MNDTILVIMKTMKFFLFVIFLASGSSVFLMGEELVFEETTLEFTATPDREELSVEFSFVVNGKDSAAVLSCNAPCTCLEAQFSDGNRLVWASGEKGKVKGVFAVGNYRGTVSKQIEVLMDESKILELFVNLGNMLNKFNLIFWSYEIG